MGQWEQEWDRKTRSGTAGPVVGYRDHWWDRGTMGGTEGPEVGLEWDSEIIGGTGWDRRTIGGTRM